MKRPKPLALLILDGWGVAGESSGNAIKAARTPNMDKFKKEYPYSELSASGNAVGLPDGQMGNSEVGHLNIGAGRIVLQELLKISKSIDDKTFFKNHFLAKAFDNAKKKESNIHFVGLLSDGGVHSHIDHLFALLKMAKLKKINPILHLILDGRDVGPKSAEKYIKQLEDKIKELGCGQIATIMGRYWAMDRDNRWYRTKKAYNALVNSTGRKETTALNGIRKAYSLNETDEFVKPTIICLEKTNKKTFHNNQIKDNDSIIFFNFRADRARQITRAMIDCEFIKFKRKNFPKNIFLVSFTEYDKTFNNPVAFLTTKKRNILTNVLEAKGLKQLRIAETEKYAHVTFFFDGGGEAVRNSVDKILVPSQKVTTYDKSPQMSANKITEKVVKTINKKAYDVIILNFANADMVGHTGILKAAVKAVETVDSSLGIIVKNILDNNGVVLITADHGNAEKMLDLKTKKPFTAHTKSKVPFLLISNDPNLRDVKLKSGILADIAPTILEILNLTKPKEMTGQSLIKKYKLKKKKC